jgi:predicted dehydrogenase|tara:strand:+ start:684 stop:1730 length:1047 start_codon:yes stop_codon:yes gene_type:complete
VSSDAANLRAAVIGCGGRGRAHAEGYAVDERTTIVACVDPVPEARDAFAESFHVPQTYADYHEMLRVESPDLVSVCTWPHFHREMIEASAESGARAILAEKPMAPTWGDARAMHQACIDRDVLLTLCHQRRFGDTFQTARKLIRDGAIGDLRRMETSCPNLFDWGTHWFDMMFFYNEETPAEWVLGQISVDAQSEVFGVRLDTSGIAWIRFANEVEGLMVTGETGFGNVNRLIGTEGIVELIPGGRTEHPLRLFRDGAWTDPDRTVGVPVPEHTIASVRNLVDCLESDDEPELSSHRALRATELIFATYESSRRRGRVVLPLDVDDSALLSMLADGTIGGGPQNEQTS